MITGKLHSIETFGAVDGPGIRTIFFMQGCSARCAYCHNPDTWNACGGRNVTLDEIVHTASRSIPYYGKDGGVTFSGGEPLMQGEFVLKAIRALNQNKINAVVDTSATYVDEYTEAIVAECEMLLLDIKHSDPKQFTRISGCSQKNLHKIIGMANEHNTPVWIRQVIVPGINDTEENIKSLAKFINTNIDNIYRAELLGYHTMALDKYKKLEIKYPLAGIRPMDKNKLSRLTKIMDNCIEAFAA